MAEVTLGHRSGAPTDLHTSDSYLAVVFRKAADGGGDITAPLCLRLEDWKLLEECTVILTSREKTMKGISDQIRTSDVRRADGSAQEICSLL